MEFFTLSSDRVKKYYIKGIKISNIGANKELVSFCLGVILGRFSLVANSLTLSLIDGSNFLRYI